MEPKINWWPIWLPIPSQVQSREHGSERNGRQNCLVLSWGCFSFFFFAERVVLNLGKLNMQFPQQINSWLKMFSVKKESFLLQQIV